MNKNFKKTNILLLSCWLFLPLVNLQAASPTASSHCFCFLGKKQPQPADTVRYQGYRLELYNFELLKRTDDWLRVRFSTVNSGRNDIDLSRPGTEHWVQFNFDQSIFQLKLGGYRENIEQQLAKDGFKLAKGERRENIELKIPTVLPSPPAARAVGPAAKPEQIPPAPADETFAGKGSGELEMPAHPDLLAEKTEPVLPEKTKETAPSACPDIRFESLQIVEQDDKWATLLYTIVNSGQADFYLYGKHQGREDNLVLRAYISGVTTLSRGALPIGGQFMVEMPNSPDKLKPGERYSGRLKLDVRKKTRYMKSLLVKLDGSQYAEECDRVNNVAAVVLD